MKKEKRTIQYNTIQYNTIQYNTIQYNTIQYITRQDKTRQDIAMQCKAIQCNAIPLFYLFLTRETRDLHNRRNKQKSVSVQPCSFHSCSTKLFGFKSMEWEKMLRFVNSALPL